MNSSEINSKEVLQELLCSDMAWIHNGKRQVISVRLSWLRIFFAVFRYPSFRLIFLSRAMRFFWLRDHSVLAAVLRSMIFSQFHSEISPMAEIGGGIQFPHPHGIIIGGTSKIGTNVHIGQLCTVGGNMGKTTQDGRSFPIIGDNVRILAGTVVAGPITIGNGAIIAPNLVIVQDIGQDTVIAGMPAYPVKIKGNKVVTLLDKIDELEKKIISIEKNKE